MTLAESQRRTLVRVLFVAVCLLPVLGIAAWALSLKLSGYRTRWEESLSNLTGLRVVVENVHYPRPGIGRVEGLRGYDAETDAVVLTCRTLEVEESGDAQHLQAAQLEIHADRAQRFFAAIERQLRREAPGSRTSTTFSANELTWIVGDESQTIVDFEVLSGPVDAGRQLLVNFRLPDTSPEHPVSIRVARGLANEPATTIEVDTGAVVLPCAMFAPLTSAAAALGPQARYTGRLRLRDLPDGWDGVVTGDVVEADLDTLVSGRFPHTLSGTAEFRIHRAEVERGKLLRLQLTVLAGPGQISRSLVSSAAFHLALGEPNAPPPSESIVPYERLAFDAVWNDGALAIKGRTAERPGAVLWSDRTVYWRESANVRLTAANLLRAVLPDRELLVPAAAQTAALLKWLPFAQSATTGTDAGATPPAPPRATRITIRGEPEAP
jgi:hypothetical protein